MKCRFFISLVFASVLQNSLATQGSNSTRIQTEMMSDYSTIEALRKVAHLRYQAAVDIIFDYLTDSAYVTCGNQNPCEDSSVTTNSSKPEVLAAFITQFDVTLLAIQIIYPEVYVNLSIAQRTGFAHIQTYVNDIYRGLELIENRNNSGNLIQIEALENKTLAASPVLNIIIYDLIRNGRSNPPKIEAAIASAQRKSYVQYIASDRSIYAGIRALLTAIASGSRAQCGTVFSAIESARSEASLALEAEIDIKFSLIENFLISLYVIQSGTVNDSSVIQAIKTAAMSNYEEQMNCTSTMMQNGSTSGSTEVTPENGNGMMANCSAVDYWENEARTQAQIAVDSIFGVLDVEPAQIYNGNQCVSEEGQSMTEIAAMKVRVAYAALFDAYLNGTIAGQPEISSEVESVRPSIISELGKLDAGINAGLELIYQNNSTGIPARIEAIQERTTVAGIVLIRIVYQPMRNVQESETQNETEIQYVQETTFPFVIQLFDAFFTGIKIRLAQVYPKYRLEGEYCSSSLEDAYNQATSSTTEIVQHVFSAIRLLSNVCSDEQSEMTEDSCSTAN